jgi:uroporphyrinogen decarboxylase
MKELTPKERVRRVFRFEEPDTVPRWCGASPEFWDKAKGELSLDDEGLRQRFGDDFRRVYARYNGPEPVLKQGATWESPFGIQREGIGYGMPMSHPLATATTVAEIEAYPWPEPARMDVSLIREDAAPWCEDYAILGGDWTPFWHDAIDLVGQENLYYMMYDHPAATEALLTRIVDYYEAVSTAIFQEAAEVIDIFFFGNDFGSQNGPLLGPDLFGRYFVPQLRRITDLGHRYDLKVMLHCCGGFRELIPQMIDVGLDALHALQPNARGMEPEGLKRDFGGYLVLNGAIDSHHVLINGTPEFVREETKRTLDIMMPGSGYVGGASHDTILEEAPVENVLTMFDTIEMYGKY